ncbi:zf-HC2 domain-containing protein [Actinoplanes sp. NPDC051470]|uniref:anti-sigma factor family protein n=1 Tax=unclassified Actinoplanes TaxID=2626549 RepID=UPI00343D6080
MSDHQTELLGAYVLGVLDPGERSTVQKHLDGCEHCRAEADELREMEAALGELPPEALIEGPPEDGDLLLQKTLREVRGERARGDRTRRAVWVAAAAVAGVAVLGGGTLIGRATAPSGQIAAPAPAISTAVPGTRGGTATDPATGAAMAVQVEPAAGWVRVHAQVSGIATGEQCRLWVVARDGRRREAGSWLVAGAASRVDGSALVAPADVASVQVETFAGRPLITVPV